MEWGDKGMKWISIALGLAVLGVAMPAAAQPPAAADSEAFHRQQEVFDKVPDTAGDGPYPAIIETDPALPAHVIYRPADLSVFEGGKMPVLAWGNGGCVDDGTAHRLHLAQIASYGYLVVAAGEWRSGPGAKAPHVPQRLPQEGGLPPAATSAVDVKAGLDWALAENAREGSRFHGRIAADKLAVAGHSCGGLQALQVATDPRIRTALIHNSGVFNSGVSSIPGMAVSKAMLVDLHAPIIYILGGPGDIAHPNGTDDFDRLQGIPAVLADLPVGHGGTFSQPMGGAVAHVAVDWLEWQLKGDAVAARTFLGANCRLCSGSDWTIKRKGF